MFAGWQMHEYAHAGRPGDLIIGSQSLFVALVLPEYLLWYRRKLDAAHIQ